MSETKTETTTETTKISVDELDNLLGAPGAESVMVPGEEKTKPSFFDTGKVDMTFIDNEPDDENEEGTEAEPGSNKTDAESKESFTDLIEEVDKEHFNSEEEPGKGNKKGRPSLDKAGMAQLVKSLIEEEVILPFDEDKPLEDYTIDDYKELFSLNIKERENKAKEETPKEFFKSLPPELQYAAKYVADGGTDLKGLFKTLAQAEENKAISIDTVEGQERAVRQFLQATNFGTEEEIQEQIDSWKDLEKLEDKAQQFKPRLDAMQEQIIKRQLAEQEQRRKQREAASQHYADSVYNTLGKGELNGLKLNSKVQNMLYDGLINPNYKSISGQPTNMFGHLIEKHQYIEPNHALIAEALWLLQDPDGYRAEIAKNTKNKTIEATARQLKIEQQNKGGGSEEPQPGADRKTNSGATLKRPQKGFFKRT